MKTLFIPLDERPCNYLYPQYIAETSDIELITPSMEQLSCKNKRRTRMLCGTSCLKTLKGQTTSYCRWT